MLARSRPAFPSDIAVVLAVAGATLTVLKDPTSLATTTMSVEEFLSSDASLPLLLVSVELPPLPRSSSSGEPPPPFLPSLNRRRWQLGEPRANSSDVRNS
jgi:hypothetical protein